MFFFGLGSRRRAPLAFVMCRQRADVIDPGPPNSLGDPASLPVCLPLSSSMHYSFIILLQLPYRPHFGEDKTCHLWVLSGGMMGDFKGEEEVDGREDDGCKECLLSPPPPP